MRYDLPGDTYKDENVDVYRDEIIRVLSSLYAYLLQLSITDIGELVDSAFAPTLETDGAFNRLLYRSGFAEKD